MKTRKWLIPSVVLTCLFILALFFAPAASAADIRSGGTIEIKQGETVPDDLYAFADTVLVDGTVQGDLIAFATKVVIGPTGVVEGDLLTGGQSLEIQGVVKDDARVAGAAITLADTAQIGDDLIAAGYSLETSPGSQVGGSLTFAGYQALLAGTIAEDLTFAGNSLELQGTVGGNAYVEVGAGESAMPISPFSFIPNMPAVPSVPAGLTVSESASIAGDLVYQSPQPAALPADSVGGEVEFTQETKPVKTPQAGEEVRKAPSLTAEHVVRSVVNWGRMLFRNFMSLLIVGLLLAWLYPRLLAASGETLKTRPWPSLGVGVLTGIVFWLVTPVLGFVLFAIVILVGLFSVGGLFVPALLIMILILLAISLAFLIAGSFISKLIICQVIGQLILQGFKSPAANHRFGPWLLGLVIFIILRSIPFVGWIVNLLAVLFGLGALVLWLFGLRPANRQPLAEPLAPQ
jgi:cytoskeletal protein CcmA (bactofilin family)